MKNLEKVIQLLYKRISSQDVIDGRIDGGNLGREEVLSLVNSYINNYSENEVDNLISYFVEVLYKAAPREGRHISEQFSVFEPIFYFVGKLLIIRDNEIICRYSNLLEWQNMVTELSQDIFVAAFLAKEMTYSTMMSWGFSWKLVLGHDNARLNSVINRGISENHSHLYGAAPIFHISWISLMNNVTVFQFSEQLRKYDRDRRYTNVAYVGGYKETPFYQRHLQAALIRLLLYSKLSGRRLKIGNYMVSIGNVWRFLALPCFRIRGNNSMEPKLEAELVKVIKGSICEIENGRSFCLKEVVCLIIEEYYKNIQEDEFNWHQIWQMNTVLTEILEGSLGGINIWKEQLMKVLDYNVGTTFSDLFLRLINSSVGSVSLDDIQVLFIDGNIYLKIWEQLTMRNVKYLLQNPDELEGEKSYIQSVIDVFRMGPCVDSEKIQGLDYALQEVDYKGLKDDQANYIFAGERWLLYMMFQKIYVNQKEMVDYFNLFYAYLLIRESIRSELVQANKNIGFRNFQKYQDRKGDFLANADYQNEFTRKAVSENLISKNVLKVELRISPRWDVESNHRQIQHLDALIIAKEEWKRRVFYTMHFHKSPDDQGIDIENMYFRHYKKREDIRIQAKAIAGLRELYPYIGGRILGIDAAGNEIGCRPEVFATVFRYLKKHKVIYETAEGTKKIPQLNATYHVGEDFLDLADGLRAIEEAVLFLNLGSGDRLGHALALGIDVQEWYEGKGYRIALPQQDYLDNLVWVYHKLFQYDIRGFENLKEWIQSEFSILFIELYYRNIQKGEIEAIMQECSKQKKNREEYLNMIPPQMDVRIFNYYRAWQLRGDDPKLYEHGFFDNHGYLEKQEKFRVNFEYPEDFDIRYIPEIALLYYMYHYNRKIREQGKKTREELVSQLYVGALVQIQKAMQREILKKGIAVEANPSSNYLIGTFRKYEKHPVIRFYNKGLVHDVELLKECPQLSVSINTDDQGIFSTSLENEYALLACALESLTDENGKALYNQTDIYDWLDRIRIMGNEQSFGNKAEGERI